MTQYFEINKMPVHVLTSNGFNVTPGIDIKETELLPDTRTNNAPTFYFSSGNHGVEFEVSVVIKETYYFKTELVSWWLNKFHKEQTPVNIVTNAFDIPNDKYLLQVKNKKQTSKKLSIWKIRFKQYYRNNENFNSMYKQKSNSLSPVDSILWKYQVIDENSPREAILALQMKLEQLGYFENKILESNGEVVPRRPNGKWDRRMVWNIYAFQADHYIGFKQGVCDRETITDFIGYTDRYASIYAVGA